MIAVLPFRGEFGLKLRYHVPAVAALPRPIAVCIEPGEEALFPDAEHVVVDRQPDDFKRRDLYAKDSDYVDRWKDELEIRYPGATIIAPDRSRQWAEKRFVPTPVTDYGLEADVVICPRARTYQTSKNWPHWSALAIALQRAGLRVKAAGVADSSDTDVARICPATWEWSRPLDATIGLMLRSRLVVATDAGLAHLAVLCGAPLLLISHAEGVVAPGEDRPGHAWWPIRLDEYYNAANHTGSPINVVHHAWYDLDPTLRTITSLLRSEAVA